jgi:hypothetical protein
MELLDHSRVRKTDTTVHAPLSSEPGPGFLIDSLHEMVFTLAKSWVKISLFCILIGFPYK